MKIKLQSTQVRLDTIVKGTGNMQEKKGEKKDYKAM